MEDEQLDRLVAALRAHKLILQGLAAAMLESSANPAVAAREMRKITGDKFVDAVPVSRMDRDREIRLNHLSADFVEKFWTEVEQALRTRSPR